MSLGKFTPSVATIALAWLLWANGPARAQSPAPTTAAGEATEGSHPVAEQMQRLFAARLASDVGLSAAQIDTVLPQIQSLEAERVRSRAQRRMLLRELRRGVASGMSDPELQRRLDALDRIGRESERTTRAALDAIDRDLSVPQRVRLRFLLVRFRDEMTRRVREFRHGVSSSEPAR